MSDAGDRSSAEATITTEVVCRLIDEQFPQWRGLPVRPSSAQGVDNATYRLGAQLSVRLPRFARWEGQVEREQRWLPRLAPHLPLPVPAPAGLGVPGAGYPFRWSVYRWIPGERADPGLLTDRTAAARDLASFLRALQSIDPEGGPAPEWSNGFRGTWITDPRDSPVVERRVRARIAALEGLADTEALTAVYRDAAAAPRPTGPGVWVHGDPAPGNLLSRDGRLSAVIDFGTLAVGDPAVDLIAAWTWLDRPAREVFREAMELDEATWARGRGWGLTAVLPDPDRLRAGDEAARRPMDELLADFARSGPGRPAAGGPSASACPLPAAAGSGPDTLPTPRSEPTQPEEPA